MEFGTSLMFESLLYTGFPHGRSHQKLPCMEISWNLKKKNNNHGKIMEFCEIIKLETTSSQKTICQTHKFCVSDS